jgi:hypothetical protein
MGVAIVMVKVVELRSFDGKQTKKYARFVLLPDGKLEVVGLVENGARTAIDMLKNGMPGPQNRVVKMDEGPLFLTLLPQNFRGSRFSATGVFEMEKDEALRGYEDMN